ncbi:MAG: hypothetical protein ABIG66_02105 [Candidatus Kerfeldbacteria bacterium]
MAKRKDVSPIVSGAGLLTTVWTELVNAVKERGGMDEEIYRLATPEGRPLIGRFADLVVEAGRPDSASKVELKPVKLTVSDSFPVTWSLSWRWIEALKAGKFDRTNSDITEDRFPLQNSPDDPAEGEYDLAVVHFGRYMSTGDVLAAVKESGYQRPSFGDGLVFARDYPDVQRDFPVAILCVPWSDAHGHRNVPCLYESARERDLYLYWFEDDWYDFWRFLVRVPRKN